MCCKYFHFFVVVNICIHVFYMPRSGIIRFHSYVQFQVKLPSSFKQSYAISPSHQQYVKITILHSRAILGVFRFLNFDNFMILIMTIFVQIPWEQHLKIQREIVILWKEIDDSFCCSVALLLIFLYSPEIWIIFWLRELNRSQSWWLFIALILSNDYEHWFRNSEFQLSYIVCASV